MNFKEAERLLEKYYNGETTLEEDKQLKDFFLQEPVPAHLESEAKLFRYFHLASAQKMNDDDFEREFMKGIDKPLIPVYTSGRRFYFALSLAASILIFAGLLFTFRDAIFRQSFKNSLTDPKLAYAETRKALMLVSLNFNEGLDQAKHLSSFQKGIEQFQPFSAFQTGMDELQKLSTFYKYQEFIINPGDQDRLQNK